MLRESSTGSGLAKFAASAREAEAISKHVAVGDLNVDDTPR